MRAKMSRLPARGFSLIETVSALVVIAIVVPMMLKTVEHEHERRISPVLISTARWLAAEQIEDVIADRHASTRGYAWIATARYPAENPVAGLPAFSRSVTVAETAADLTTAGTGYKTVTVDVSWTDGRGQARSLSLSTVLTEYGP